MKYADQKRKQEEPAAEKAVVAEIKKRLEKAVSKALDDIFKDWNCTCIIHRPFLTDEERKKREEEVCRALAAFVRYKI